MLQHLFVWIRMASHSQILCGISLSKGNESLFAAFGHMTKMAATNWANEGMKGQGQFLTLASVGIHLWN